MQITRLDVVVLDLATALLLAALFHWLFGPWVAYPYLAMFASARAWKGYGLMFTAFELTGVLKPRRRAGGAK